MDSQIECVKEPLPLLSLLTRPVVVSITNNKVLFPQHLHVDTHVSCLVNPNQVQRVWPPLASIGLWMSTYGCIIALSLFAFVPLSIMHFCPRYIVVSMMTVSHAVYFIVAVSLRATISQA